MIFESMFMKLKQLLNIMLWCQAKLKLYLIANISFKVWYQKGFSSKLCAANVLDLKGSVILVVVAGFYNTLYTIFFSSETKYSLFL